MAKPMSENESLRSLIFQMQDALWVIWESYHCKKMPDAEHYSAWNRVFEALEEARLFFSQIHLAKEKKAREENREGNKQKEAGYHYNRGLIVCDACHQSFYCSEHFHNHLLENGVCPVSWGLPPLAQREKVRIRGIFCPCGTSHRYYLTFLRLHDVEHQPQLFHTEEDAERWAQVAGYEIVEDNKSEGESGHSPAET